VGREPRVVALLQPWANFRSAFSAFHFVSFVWFAVHLTRNYLRYLAGQSHLQEIHFLWRPFLRDANDDMVLELSQKPIDIFR